MPAATPLPALPPNASTREGFGQAMVELGEKNKNVVALCADLTESLRLTAFKNSFPERFVEVGVAEQNLVGVSAGLALAGKIPFAGSFAVFSPGRSWDQLRVSVCYSNLNVKIIGGHAGLTVGPDGATHQALEDIAMTRVLPNLTVVVPCDAEQTRAATHAIAKHVGPCYLRLGRDKTPTITKPDTPFTLGKAQVLEEGSDVTIIACGVMVAAALAAAKSIRQYNKIKVRVINLHTIKPLDKSVIVKAAMETKCIVTAEEHQMAGGMGSAVAELLSEHYPVPIIRVGVKDTFGESGQSQELLTKYGLTQNDIEKAVWKVLELKK